MNDPSWKQRKKHIFILSEAGKPIYTRFVDQPIIINHVFDISIKQARTIPFYHFLFVFYLFRYGNEENLVTLMGLMQAIISFVQDNKDNIRYVNALSYMFQSTSLCSLLYSREPLPGFVSN